MVQAYCTSDTGDLWLFIRPELAQVFSGTGASAAVTAVRAGLDWNLPMTAQRANLLIEGAGNFVGGDSTLVRLHDPVWELRLMLRLSLTRHNRV